MNADLSEGETESRPQNPFSCDVRLKVDVDVGRLTDRDGLKGGHWVDEDAGRESDDSARLSGDGNSGNRFKGTADLTTGFRDSSNGRQPSSGHDHGAVARENEKELPSSNRRKVEVMSSEGDGDEETEDDFEEGDGAIAEVASDPSQQQRSQRCRNTHQTSRRRESQLLPPPPATSVGWETFLPQRNIRVLLAEDDDSTRQIVGALLRNCGYEVFSVANGMQAWEMLEDSNNHFDLVLTDVVMPCLSGVGLLTKIMSNEAGKKIPVIMMSSHDSLDIVFRCLSKGAADFLVKPVRKNELKNLWQHVWRCQSSTGSGSGSGIRRVVRPKSRVGSGNNIGSNDGSDDNSSELNVRGGSDDGSGTQPVLHINHKLKRGNANSDEGQVTSSERLSNEQMGQDLEMATRRPDSEEMEKASHLEEYNGAEAMEEDVPSTSGNSGNKLEKEYCFCATISGGSSANAIDLIGGIAYQNKEDVEEGAESGDVGEGSDRGASNSPGNDKCVTSSISPLLELSLKRPRAGGEDDTDEKRVLRHSGGSAFSRYSTNGTTIQHIPAGSPVSLNGYPLGSVYGTHALSSGGPFHFSIPSDQSSKGSGEASTPLPMRSRMAFKGNGQDMGSSKVDSSTPEGYSPQIKDKVASVSPLSGQGVPIPMPLAPHGLLYDGVSAAYGQAIHQVFYSHTTAPPWASGAPHLSDRGEVFDHPPYLEHGSHMPYHLSHHHQQETHHHSRLAQPSFHSPQEEQVITNQGTGLHHCGSSNMAGSLPDGNNGQSGSSHGYGSTGNGNESANGSGSGSNNQNGQSCFVLNSTQNQDCGCNNSANGSVEPSSVFGGHEQNRFARREAALNKFRQKRKDRCFEKKVRYQSRKRLAEQRPRVRGQFVRQAVYNSNARGDMCD